MGVLESQFNLRKLEISAKEAYVSLPPLTAICEASLAGSALALAAAALSFAMGKLILLLAFLAGSLLILRIPSILVLAARRNSIRQMENELPYALRYFIHLLDLGLTPVRALEQLSRMRFGGFSRLVESALLEGRKGRPLESALAGRSEPLRSEKLDEAVAAITSILAEGSSGESREILSRIAASQAEAKLAELETYSAKSQVTVLGAIFTMALLPTISAFMLSFSRHSAAVPVVLFVLVFPLASLGQFVYLKVSAP